MILYHFTDPRRIPSIKKSGIIKGDVPITVWGGFNAPWFTTDSEAGNQSWEAGTGKSDARITVEIPDGDSKLVKWTDLISEELNKLEGEEKAGRQKWYNVLNEVGGGGQDNWYIYKGIVSPNWIKKIDLT